MLAFLVILATRRISRNSVTVVVLAVVVVVVQWSVPGGRGVGPGTEDHSMQSKSNGHFCVLWASLHGLANEGRERGGGGAVTVGRSDFGPRIIGSRSGIRRTKRERMNTGYK